VLDVEKALPRFSNDPQVYRDFLEEFITELPDRIKYFQKLFRNGDYQVLADRAHNLKGISASMGANQLAFSLQLLDQHSQDGDSDSIGHMLYELEEQIQLVLNEANTVLSS
jgi:HPt (histidine-containing phosphotransfer) domain-containing protein